MSTVLNYSFFFFESLQLKFETCECSHPVSSPTPGLTKDYEEVKTVWLRMKSSQLPVFPNDCSVVWYGSECLLGLKPIHLCLGKFTVRCNLNVKDSRDINVTTQTWMHSPSPRQC
jgi:hypothetical protein